MNRDSMVVKEKMKKRETDTEVMKVVRKMGTESLETHILKRV